MGQVGERTAARLVALGALALLLVTWPVLAAVDRPVLVLGLPLPWVHLLVVWVLVVVLAALVVRDP